jgi:gamma-glutamylcyclotransferase (GGCT)/AIG2-like uncharacterized protein YtfP/general stress protein 26
MNDPIYVFVYGTLRPPRASVPVDQCRFFPQVEPYLLGHSPATLANGELFDLGTFPAARPGRTPIQGDLLTLEPAALPIMDRLEGHPVFFYREQVTVATASGDIAAWIYWAPASLVANAAPLPSGDWFARAPAAAATEPSTTTDPALAQLVSRFRDTKSIWLSTVRPSGQAHSTPIWHVWHRGRIYLVTTREAIKVANIRKNPSVVATHPDTVHPIIIEGWATVAPSTWQAVKPLFQSKYDWDIDGDADYDTVIEITPTKLMAWGDQGHSRWPGAELMRIW